MLSHIIIIVVLTPSAACMIDPQKGCGEAVQLVPHIHDASTPHFGAKHSQTSRHQTAAQHDKGEQENCCEEEQQHRNVAHEEEEDHDRDQDCQWQGVLRPVKDTKPAVVRCWGGYQESVYQIQPAGHVLSFCTARQGTVKRRSDVAPLLTNQIK